MNHPDSTLPAPAPTSPDASTVPSRGDGILVLRGTAVLPRGVLPDAAIHVAGGRITYAGPAAEAPDAGDAEVHEHDGLILPGLVDLHDHGGGGASFPDATEAAEAMTAVLEHRRHGTTSIVASLVTASAATLRDRVAMLAGLVADGEIAALHLEGPFISPARCGAQNPEHIATGDAALVAELCELSGGTIATMTLAPEVVGADAVIDALVAGGAIPSLGHTDSSAAVMEHGIEHAVEALRRGHGRSPLPTATHLFNGMRPIHHRDPGPALACLDAASRGEMIVEVIADGVHTAAETVRYVMDLAGPDHVVLVTDAMAAAGMPDGSYSLGALDVTVADHVATLTDGGAIAGGTAHLVDVVRFAVQRAGVELGAAVHSASAVPARVLGLQDELGALSAGHRADVLLTDGDLRPVRVLRGGVDVRTA